MRLPLGAVIVVALALASGAGCFRSGLGESYSGLEGGDGDGDSTDAGADADVEAGGDGDWDLDVDGLSGDLDGNGCVDRADVEIVTAHRDQPASACPPCDLDGDGLITVLDARRLVILCSRPNCVSCT